MKGLKCQHNLRGLKFIDKLDRVAFAARHSAFLVWMVDQ